MVGSFNNWGKIAANITPACQEITHETATEVAAIYSDTAAKDTGFMASSVYVSDSQGSTYGQSGNPPQKDAYLLPEVKPDDETSAIVGVAANYAIFPELGTRFQPAQPAFYPAVEAGRGILDAKCSQFEGLIGKIS